MDGDVDMSLCYFVLFGFSAIDAARIISVPGFTLQPSTPSSAGTSLYSYVLICH